MEVGDADEAVVGGDVDDPQPCPTRVAKVAVSLFEAASTDDRGEAVLVAGEHLVQQSDRDAEPGCGADGGKVAVEEVFFDVGEGGIEQARLALARRRPASR